MAELKRDFSGAKMNKDMDERVLPPGQYRDANNIQIATSDGSDVGALQTLMGNTERTASIVPDDYCTCVGVLPLPEKDLIYYFVAGGGIKGYQPLIKRDYILEYDTITRTTKYVFVDIYSIHETQSGANSTNKYFTILDNGDATNTTGVRIGMHITGTFTNNTGGNITVRGATISNGSTYSINVEDNVVVMNVVKVTNGWKVYHDYLWDNGSSGAVLPIADGESVYFQSPFGERILQFEPLQKIHSINHLDGMIFWTDGVNEPKKIHIERSKLGTGYTYPVVGWDDDELSTHANNTGNTTAKNIPADHADNFNFHTRLVISDKDLFGYEIALNRNETQPWWVKLEHVTVIKQNPKFPLEVEMLQTSLDRTPDPTSSNAFPTPNLTYGIYCDANDGVPDDISFYDHTDPADPVLFPTDHSMTVYFDQPVDFRIGDVLLWNDEMAVLGNDWNKDDASVRTVVTSAPSGMPNNGGSVGDYGIKILSNSSSSSVARPFHCRLEDKKPMFEFKFPRFSYRWKYQDGEYSTFAPWTRVAFLPGDFDYLPKKGYNLGMTNRLRSLRLKNYFHEFELVPSDVVQVDLLYKEEGNNTIYTVKEIKRKDGDPEWPDRATSAFNRGKYNLTSEMIHAVVPSNQLLRPWDNVPRSALTQEMSSNRLIYGNYKQNYNVDKKLMLDLRWSNNYKKKSESLAEIPERSCKTLRTYQVGVVFMDDYGRESPVLVPKEGSSISLDKKWSTYTNRLVARLNWQSKVPTWAEYFKYYIKETSNEFYNLAMDRWYDAEDGNVWISFPSAERNKVDEDTYLILKNEHDSNKAVLEAGRYKIIAIENDAPTFVKTTKKSHGSVLTNVTSGATLAALTNILVDKTDTDGTSWDENIGSDWIADVYSKIAQGNLYARITATDGNTVVGSDWIGVTSLRTVGDDIAVKLDQAIGDTANQDDNLTSPTYRIEFREHMVQHKPEFDGRFFVKLHKDMLLQQAVMKELDIDQSMTIQASFNMRFIMGQGDVGDNKHPTPTTLGTYVNSSGTQATHQYNYSTSSSDFPTSWGFDSSNRMGYCGGRQESKDFWEQRDNFWFIDGAGHKNTTLNSGGSGWHNAENGVHSSHLGGKGPGTGGIRHFANYSRIFFGIRRWYDYLSTTQRNFYDIMSTPGTIFKFRDDPTNEGIGTAYQVIRRRGWRQTYNYHRGTGCKTCKDSWPSCRRLMFAVDFERLDQSDGNGGAMDAGAWDPLSAYKHDGSENGSEIDIYTIDLGMRDGGSSMSSENPAIFETEPKEDVGLDIYYEASGAIPLDVRARNNELLIPYFSTCQIINSSGAYHRDANGDIQTYQIYGVNQPSNKDLTQISITPALLDDLAHDQWIPIERYDGSRFAVYASKSSGNYSAGDATLYVVTGKAPTNEQTNQYQPWRAPHHQPFYLGFHNCWQYGNGVETDRIRDDYNAPQLSNGVKASAPLAVPYAEEHRSSGLIWSGIFNSTSGINNLNQFIQAEPITKDLSPRHGTIQKLVGRDTDTLAFCEDKVLRLLTDKDALFNADGNTNVTASNAVIGQATPISGDYGISTNPESLAVTPHGMYWCDQMRGQVLALEGGMSIKSISDIGMKDYFNDNLQDVSEVVGTYDDKKNEYNITYGKKNWPQQFRSTKTTLSYSELTQGWVSFKSFGPEHGISMNNEYYTWDKGSMWQHHSNALANNFYGSQYYSDVTLMFNDNPAAVKSFNTINYEGSQSRITQFTTTDGYTDKEYYNLDAKAGWYVDTLSTNLQEAENLEFKSKEGKWFSTVKGTATTLSNLDEKEFSVQGLGSIASTTNTGTPAKLYNIEVHAHPSNAAGTTNWDSSADADFKIGSYQSITGAAGATIAAGSSISYIDNLTLTNGLYTYSGLDLDAADFSVPGGTATTSGEGNETVYIYTAAAGWSADTTFSSGSTVATTGGGIWKVEFTNQGIAGDPGNVVEAKAYYKTFTMPSSQYNLHFDVDNSTTTTFGGNVYREMCLRTSYNIDAGSTNTRATVTANAISGITKADNVSFLGTGWRTEQWSAQVLQGQSTLVADYTVTADSNYHLDPMGNGKGVDPSWVNRLVNTPWAPYYTWTVTDTYYTSTGNTGLIQSSRVKIYYTPPVGISGLDPDPISPEGTFCAFLHDIRLGYNSLAAVTRNSIGDRIGSLSVSTSRISPGSILQVYANANAAGTARLYVAKQGTGTPGVATHYYDFNNDVFDAVSDGVQYKQLTFVANTSLSQAIVFPTTDETATYSVWLGDDTGVGTSLARASSVPDAINELNVDIARNVTATFTPGALTNVTPAGSLTIKAGKEMSAANTDYAFSFTYTRTGSRTLSISDTVIQPEDIVGAYAEYPLTANENSGVTTLHINPTQGAKVGMYIQDGNHVNNGEPATARITKGSTITSVATNDSVAFAAATSASMSSGEPLIISSDWEYELISSTVSINGTNTIVTIAGTIRIKKYGKTTPDGNIILEPSFITTT